MICKKIDFNDFKNKTILELGSGVGFFLRNIYNELPEDSIYIAIDNNLERHRFLKSILETMKCSKNIIFICCDFTKIPIEDKSIDVVVDIFGSSNYAFSNEEFLLDKVDEYIKQQSYLIGSYIIFKKFIINSKIADTYKKNYYLDNIKEKIKNQYYKTIYDKQSKVLKNGGKYEDYFVRGEEVYFYLYYGKR